MTELNPSTDELSLLMKLVDEFALASENASDARDRETSSDIQKGTVKRLEELAQTKRGELVLELQKFVPERSEAEDEQIVEAVTKAILFEDCGNAEDWKDNVDLGKAAIRAYRMCLPSYRR